MSDAADTEVYRRLAVAEKQLREVRKRLELSSDATHREVVKEIESLRFQAAGGDSDR